MYIHIYTLYTYIHMTGGTMVKDPSANAGDTGVVGLISLSWEDPLE